MTDLRLEARARAIARAPWAHASSDVADVIHTLLGALQDVVAASNANDHGSLLDAILAAADLLTPEGSEL